MSQPEGIISRIVGAIGRYLWLIILLTSIYLNVALARQLTPPPVAVPKAPQIGVSIANATLRDAATGNAIDLSSAANPRLIYASSSECDMCRRNEANLNALAQCAGRQNYDVAVVYFREASRTQVASTALQTWLDPGGSLWREAHFDRLPTTLLVGTTGQIEDIWTGAYDGPLAKAMSAKFDCRLPGLLPK